MKELSEVSANAWSYPVPAMEIGRDVWKDVIHKWEGVAQQAPPTTPGLSIQQIILKMNATYFTQQFVGFMEQLIIKKNLPGSERSHEGTGRLSQSQLVPAMWQVHTFALVISRAASRVALICTIPASFCSHFLPP